MKKTTTTRRNNVASPPRVRVKGGGGDAIAKLKKMNSSLQSSYHQQPAVHDQPFIPSSAKMKNPVSPNSPNSKHKYWYSVEKAQSPSAPKTKSSGDYDDFYGDASPQTRGGHSEYDENYVNGKLPQKPPRSPERQLTSLNNFMVDANTSTWKSEQHDNFRNLPLGHEENSKVAGVSTKDKDTYPTSFAWNLTQKSSELNKKDPTSSKGDHVDEADVGKQNTKDGRLSEHDQKFQWPPAAERVIYTNPDKQFTPFPKDVSHINAVNWKSEYDDANNHLSTNKITAQDAPVAGIANRKLDKANPSFYAWDKEKETQDMSEASIPPEVHDPSYPYNYKMGDTEYKKKFKEWPVDHAEEVAPAVRHRATGSNVFPPSAESDYAELRQTSTHKHDFPKYSDREMASSAATTAPIVREKPPTSFAWSTLEKENSDYIPPHRERQGNGVMEETEYNRKFHWPPQEALQHSVNRKDSSSSSEMQATLAHGHIGAENPNQVKSEYQKQFIDKRSEFVAMSPNRIHSANPPQFAWPLVNGQPLNYPDDDDHGKAKPKKPLINDKELSEHTSKFRWPEANGSSHGQKPLDEGAKYGSIYAVDPEDLNSSKWQSEYDEKCAALRKKQQALKSTMVAGKPSHAREPIPVNFAWENSTMPPPPPPVASAAAAAYKPRHANPEHFHSEYEEKFLPWHMEKNEAHHQDGERLNLFAEDQSSGGLPSKAMRSEYEAQFNAKDGLVADQVRFKANNQETIPPQFAWPLDDESLPKPPPKPTKPSPPLEKTEHESNFTWHAAPPSKPVKRTSNEAPIAVDGDQPESAWKSEYDANTEKASKTSVGPNAPPRAGIIGIKAEDVPSFFAWADAEEKKTPVLPEPPLFPAEVVPTEYQERFKSTGLTAEDKPKRFKEPQNPDWFHLERGNGSFATEYDSNFQWKTAQANPRFQDMATSGLASTARHNSAPHQFAWSLIDGARPRPKSAPPRTSNVPFKEVSEYDSKFNWTPEDYKHPRESLKSNHVDHFQSAATLDFDPAKDGATSQWESEYDNRCEQLRKKQREVLASTVDSAAATVSNMRTAADAGSSPPFFAWQDVNRESQSLAEERKSRRPQIPTETTEYRDKFSSSTSNSRPSTPTGNLRFSNSAINGGSHLTVPRQKFEGRSEYDTQFSASDSTIDLNHSGLHRSIMREKQLQPSLRNTILDLESYQPAEPVVASRTKSSPPRRSAQSGFATEQSDRFVWPEARQSQQSYEQAVTQKHVMRSTASQSTILPGGMISQVVASKMSSAPLTETQQNFSWPDAAKLSQHDPQLSPRKKSQMKTALQNGVKRYSVMKKAPSSNVYRKDKPPSQLYNDTFSRRQQMHPHGHVENNNSSKQQKPVSSSSAHRSQEDHDDSFSIPSDLQHPHSVAEDSNRFAATTGTVMSQDSLNIPSGSRAGTSSRNSYTNAKTNETMEPSSPVSVADSATLESRTAKTESDIGRKEIFARENSVIHNLRTDNDIYRSRSVPPKQRLGQILTSDSGLKYRVYRDESPSNPVLMHRRYPSVTDRQTTRWSTETRDNFRWRNSRSGSPLK